MDYAQILNLIIAIAPAVTSILGIILAVCQFFRKFKLMMDGQQTDIDDVKDMLNKAIENNRDLQSKLDEVIASKTITVKERPSLEVKNGKRSNKKK